MPLFRAHPVEGGVAGDAGVVDQDLHRPQPGLNGLDQRAAAVRVGHVAFEQCDVIALAAHGLLPLLRLFGVAVVGGDAVPLIDEALADGGTNAAGTTGDQCDARCHGLNSRADVQGSQ